MGSEATTNMFGGQQVEESEGFVGESSAAAGTRTRQARAPAAHIGKALPTFDSRKWGNFDMARGKSANVAFEVTRDDRMSASEAGAMLKGILENFGLNAVPEGNSLAFCRGMWLCHAVNSGSQLQPGRARIIVGNTTFEYSKVLEKLGVNQRRFFRAFADEVRDEVQRWLDNFDPSDPSSVEVCSWIKEIAVDRVMQRYPALIADSASACTGLTYSQLATLANSTNVVLSSSVNAIDGMQARAKPVTADAFDSTNMSRVDGAKTYHSGRN